MGSKKSVRYTHHIKGGVYEIVIDGSEHGSIKPAGTLKGDHIVLYRDVESGQVYVRHRKDFVQTMEVIKK